MAKVQEIGPYSAYAIAVKYGYKGTEEEWVQEQEANRKAAEAAAAAAAQSAKDAAASASGAAQSGQQAVQNIKDAQTAAEQAIDTAKQQAVQAAQAEAEKAAASAGQAASSAAEAAQSATDAAEEVGKVQSAGAAAVQAVQQAQSTATGAVSDAQQSATQAVSQAQTAAVSAVQAEGTAQTNAVASAASSALTGISGAKDAALSDVAEAGTAQVSAVGTAGADAVEDVNDAKTAALEAIDAANAALPSPTQSDAGKVPTVKADGSAYELAGPYAPLSAAIRPTASGNPVSITDSVEWPLQGLKVYGKSTQDGTPSPENPVPIVSAGDGGSIDLTVCGANILNFNSIGTITNTNGVFAESPGYRTCILNTQSIDSIYISGDFVLLNYETLRVGFFEKYPKIGDIGIRSQITNSSSIDVRDYNYVSLSFLPFQQIEWNQIESNFIVSIGDNPIPYEPYKSQSLTISTPNGLPGIPVDSGGNYTDASGQRWYCDIVDFTSRTYTKNVDYVDLKNYTFIFNSAWTNQSDTLVYAYAYVKTNKKIVGTLSNKLVYTKWKTSPNVYSEYQTTIEDTSANKTVIYVILPKTDFSGEISTKTFNDYMSNAGIYALVPLETPIKTPLSEEEIAAYRALHTYDGATVVSTTEDVAGLEVKYLADGEKYVERIVSQNAPEAAAAHTMALLAGGIREGVNGV